MADWKTNGVKGSCHELLRRGFFLSPSRKLASRAKSFPLFYETYWNLIFFSAYYSSPPSILIAWCIRERMTGLWDQIDIDSNYKATTYYFCDVNLGQCTLFLPPGLSHLYLGHINTQSRVALFPSTSLPSPHFLERWALFIRHSVVKESLKSLLGWLPEPCC